MGDTLDGRILKLRQYFCDFVCTLHLVTELLDNHAYNKCIHDRILSAPQVHTA